MEWQKIESVQLHCIYWIVSKEYRVYNAKIRMELYKALIIPIESRLHGTIYQRRRNTKK